MKTKTLAAIMTVIGIAIFASWGMWAQDIPTAPGNKPVAKSVTADPGKAPPPVVFTLALTLPQINVVLAGLGELKLKDSLLTLTEIKRHCKARQWTHR